jgi:hypothetical protein
MTTSATVFPSEATVSRLPGAVRGTLALALVVEALLALGFAWPLWLFHHHVTIPTPEPLAIIFGISAAGTLRFALLLLAWLVAYALACLVARRPLTRGARRVLFLAPVAFAATLLFVLPVSSKDVYHYTMEGRALVVYGDNPGSVPPAAYPDDKLYWIMSSWQDTASRYGPLHNLLAGAIVAAGRGNLMTIVLGFKLVTTVAALGTAGLTWATMRRVRPELALPAYVFVAWNPQLLYEAAANAHNDVLMVFFTALALYLAARRRPDLSIPALALGTLTKYIVVLLAPLIMIDALRRGMGNGEWRRVGNGKRGAGRSGARTVGATPGSGRAPRASSLPPAL